MNKKISLSLTISLMALTAAVTFIITLSFSAAQFNAKISDVSRLSEKYQRLDELDAKVREKYYKDVPEDEVLEELLAGYVKGLGDPYSTYYNSDNYQKYEDHNAGVYTGIGITISQMENGDAEIVAVAENGPAAQAGIEAGDYLVAVEGVSVKDDYAEATDRISGENGTAVSITIRKHDSGIEQTLSLTRSKIDETTVTGEMLEHRIGYIRISKFRTVSVEQFSNILNDLIAQGAQAFIFDVRSNGGGMLSALEKMADPLLPEGELAFSYDKEGNASPIIKSDAKQMKMPYAVLVNGGSASAAELFACLMRDYADAVLVGEKTYGKGVMQTTYALSEGAVTLTTATYATGKTPCYHGIGLEPDIVCTPDPESQDDTQLVAAIETLTQQLESKDAA